MPLSYHWTEQLTADEALVLMAASAQFFRNSLADAGWNEDLLNDFKPQTFQSDAGPVELTVFDGKDYFSHSQNAITRSLSEDHYGAVKSVYAYGKPPASHQQHTEDRNPESQGLMTISRLSSTGQTLFDHPAEERELFSLKISSSYSQGVNGDFYEYYPTLKILFSREQYLRFLRSDVATIPCTIDRIFGRGVDSPGSTDAAQMKTAAELQEDLEQLFADVTAKLTNFVGTWTGKGISAKKDLKVFQDDLETILAEYRALEPDVASKKQSALSAIGDQFKAQLAAFAHQESLRLPEGQRQAFLLTLDSSLDS